MVLIVKSKLNRIVTPLHDLPNVTSGTNWLIRFVNEQEEDIKIIALVQDVSLFAYNYSEFWLEEGVDISLPIEGFYHCEFYQMPNDTSEDINDGVLIKSVKSKVIGVSDYLPTFIGSSNNTIFNG